MLLLLFLLVFKSKKQKVEREKLIVTKYCDLIPNMPSSMEGYALEKVLVIVGPGYTIPDNMIEPNITGKCRRFSMHKVNDGSVVKQPEAVNCNYGMATEEGYRKLVDIGNHLRGAYPNVFNKYEHNKYGLLVSNDSGSMSALYGIIEGINGSSPPEIKNVAFYDEDGDIAEAQIRCARVKIPLYTLLSNMKTDHDVNSRFVKFFKNARNNGKSYSQNKNLSNTENRSEVSDRVEVSSFVREAIEGNRYYSDRDKTMLSSVFNSVVEDKTDLFKHFTIENYLSHIQLLALCDRSISLNTDMVNILGSKNFKLIDDYSENFTAVSNCFFVNDRNLGVFFGVYANELIEGFIEGPLTAHIHALDLHILGILNAGLGNIHSTISSYNTMYTIEILREEKTGVMSIRLLLNGNQYNNTIYPINDKIIQLDSFKQYLQKFSRKEDHLCF